MLALVALLPEDIKSKILIYYLSYGTPTSIIMRSEIIKKCKNNTATIWFANVDYTHNHRLYLLQKSIGCSFDTICDLRLAIVETNIKNGRTNDLLKKIQNNVINNLYIIKKNDLLRVLEEEEEDLFY
jgi:hypothetical protein